MFVDEIHRLMSPTAFAGYLGLLCADWSNTDGSVGIEFGLGSFSLWSRQDSVLARVHVSFSLNLTRSGQVRLGQHPLWVRR